MNKSVTIALAMAAGLAGGFLSRYLNPPVAFAQGQAAVAKEVRAEKFVLVDNKDRALGAFSFDADPRFASLSRHSARNPMNLLDNGTAPGRIVLHDARGRDLVRCGWVDVPAPVSQVTPRRALTSGNAAHGSRFDGPARGSVCARDSATMT